MGKTNEAIKVEMVKAYEKEIDKLLSELDETPYDFAEFEQALLRFVHSNAKAATELVQTHKDFSPSEQAV